MEASKPAARPWTCLIVEDEALISLDLEDAFSATGFAVAGPFARCADALLWLEKVTPDLAVLDTVLQDGSCAQLAAELRRRHIPFIIYSGLTGDDSASELNDVPWVDKPSPAEVVLRAATELLANNGSSAQTS
jgi:DNA-binding response OmpR family regulator